MSSETASPKFKFSEGERVLCFHGPLIYEAKALKSTVTKDKQIKYYIHYAGWNKNWDEWVPEYRVLKYNDANVQRQKEVSKEHAAAKKNKKGSAKGKKGDTSGSESRASTPSKDVTTTPLAAPTASTASTTSSITATATSRSNRGTKQTANATTAVAATTRPPTPITKETSSGSEGTSKKDDSSAKEDESASSKEESQKKKRGGSHTSDKSATPTPTNNINSNSGITTAPASTPAANSSRVDVGVESEETFLSKIEVKIKIPDELKIYLSDDWDAITRQHKLIEIPAKTTVQDIADQYVAFKRTAKSTNATKEVAINDVVNGIIEYFNVMLGSQLLYKSERPQYAELLQKHPETPLSKLYGSFHLLRLFVKLGSMLGYSSLDEKSIQILLVHVHDFLKFLVKNSAIYFSMAHFVNVDPEYVRDTQ